MPKYRKKPVVIEAVQFTEENKEAAYSFVTNLRDTWPRFDEEGIPLIAIDTLEGLMLGRIGDYIIKGIKGEFYPCKENIFNKSYELVEEENA